ncbi:unnamed protein product, partial [Meganyctiphanes norvegica]
MALRSYVGDRKIGIATEIEIEKLISNDGGDDEDDDDFFLRGPSTKKTVRFAGDKLKDVKVQISEVTDVMRDNVGRLLERGDRLDHLQDQSDGLASSADAFRTSASRMRREMWWQNTRGKLFLSFAAVVIILLIIIPVIIKYSS